MCLRSCEVAQGTNMAAGAGLCSLFTTTSAKEPWLLLLRLEQPQLWGRIGCREEGAVLSCTDQEAPAVSNLPAPVHIGQNEREGLPGTLSEWGPLVPIWEAKQGDGSEQPLLLLLLTPKQVLSLGKLVDDPGLIIFP